MNVRLLYETNERLDKTKMKKRKDNLLLYILFWSLLGAACFGMLIYELLMLF